MFCFLFALQVGWKRRPTIDQWSVFAQNPFHLFLPCHFIPAKTHLQTPRPIKDKNSFKRFSSQLPQRLKTAEAPLQLSILTRPPFSHLL